MDPSLHDDNVEETIANEDVLQKYRASANAVNHAILKVAEKALIPGKRVVDLCELGDALIREGTASHLKKKKGILRGVAFPTCININQVVCHYSPDSTDNAVTKEGDVLRIDMGAHIDGYIAVAATTLIVSPNLNHTIRGRAADALAAAEKCVEASIRLMKPGHKNTEVTQAVAQIATDFGVELCEGVLSHELKRFVIDGNNVIIQKPGVNETVDEFEFQENQVFSLDVCITTGPDGKIKESSSHVIKPFVYKLNPEQAGAIGGIRRQSARDVHKAIVENHGTMPFTVRNLDKKTGRLGLLELQRCGLVDPYPVLTERAGEFVAHIKTTVWISSSNVTRATQAPTSRYASDRVVVNEEIRKLLATSTKFKKAKKAAAAAAAASASGGMDMSDD